MIYIVLGPGRSGSNLLCYMLSGEGNMPGGVLFAARTEIDTAESIRRTQDFLKLSKRWNNASIVVHSHDPDVINKLLVDPKECVLILSKRRNLFELIMSHFVTSKTQQWHSYTDLEITPFNVPQVEFINSYAGFSNWYKSVNLTIPYHSVYEIYYEDIKDIDAGNKYLAKMFNVDETSIEFVVPPRANPHNYKDWISNWEELYTIYNTLMGIRQVG